MLERLTDLDHLAFCAVNGGLSRPALDIFFGLFTNLAEAWALIPLGYLGLYLFDRKNFPKNFIVLAVVTLLGGLWVQIIKSLIGRPRPLKDALFAVDFAAAVKTQVLSFLPKWTAPMHATFADPGGWCEQLNLVGRKLSARSYPSGHSAAAFGVAAALIYAYRRWWAWALLVPAALIGVSRMYVGVHFPLDVLVGGAIGVVNAVVMFAALRPYTGMGLVRPKAAVPAVHPSDAPVILMVAGEASSDAYAANLVIALKARTPGARVLGVGGPRAVEAGLEPLGRADEIAIVGFTGVVAGLAGLRRVYRAMLGAMDTMRPDLLVCLDLPDFNLGLANQAKARGIPVLYYISPQVWAWRKGRVRTIADRVDHMVVALPFEKDLYERHGVPVSFFGHPILETIGELDPDRDAARRALGLDPARPVVVLAPGSRGSEIHSLAPTLAETARQWAAERPETQFVVPLAPSSAAESVPGYFAPTGIVPIYTRGDFFRVLACADAGIVASGTATLEAALAGMPQVIVYRANALNAFIGRRVVKVDKIGLPNIILGRTAFTELLQEDCSPQSLLGHLRGLLAGPEREAALAACREVRAKLRGGAVSREVAELALRMIELRGRDRAESGRMVG